jgi:hypothetical protein
VEPVEIASNGEAGKPAPGIRPADLAGIELRHAIPGRVRLRFPALRGDAVLSREVQKQLAALPVVRRVEVNPLTGSVLVLYDPADSAAIAQLGRLMIPGLDLDAMPGPDDREGEDGLTSASPTEAVASFTRRLNERLEAATGGSVDLKLLVPASLFAGGLLRLVASRKVPSPTWYDFLWFAFGTYFTLNRGQGPDTPAERAQPLNCDESDEEAEHPGTAGIAANVAPG